MPPRGQARRKAAATVTPFPRIQQLGLRVAQNGDLAHFTLAELELATVEARDTMNNSSGPPLWIAVGDGGQTNLQALYALILRRSCATISASVGESFRTAYAALRRALTGQLRKTTNRASNLPVCGLRVMLVAVLRGHALRCFSNLLSGAAAQLGKPTFRRTQHNMEALAQILEETLGLLDACRALLARWDSDDYWTKELRALSRVLHEELLASAVLEHGSRLVLLMTTCEVGMRKARLLLFFMTSTLPELFGLGRQDQRHVLLEGQPCLAYLLSSHVVGLCATLDGGPMYGLPRQSPLTDGEQRGASASSPGPTMGPSVAPLFTINGQPLLTDVGNAPSTVLVRLALLAWEDAIREDRDGWTAVSAAAGDPAAAAGAAQRQVAVAPYNTKAVFAICMRLAAVATASVLEGLQDRTSPSVTAAASTAAVDAVLARTHSLGLVTPVSEAPQLAELAFSCAQRAIYSGFIDAADGQPAMLAPLLGCWWAALAAYVDAAAAAVVEGDLQALDKIGRLLAVPAPRQLSDGLPPRPTACVAAAVAAGYIPSMTRAILALDYSGKPPWELCLCNPDPDDWAWAQMLAFGSPTEMAALVTSMTWMLSRAASRLPVHYEPTCPSVSVSITQLDPAKEYPALETLCYALEAVTCLYSATIKEWTETVRAQPQSVEAAGLAIVGAAAAADIPEGLPRLSLLMSYVAVHLLPTVVDVLLCCVLPVGGYNRRLREDGEFEARMCDGVTALLSWVALLVATQVQQPEGADGADVPIDDPSRLPRSPAMTGWRELLLCELHMPELLGVAIRVSSACFDREFGESRAERLAWALRALLAFTPAELAAALTSPRAALAAHLAESFATDGEDPLEPLQPPPTSGGGLHPFLGVCLDKTFGKRGSKPQPRLIKLIKSVCNGTITPDAAATAAAKLLDPADSSWWRSAALMVPPARLHQLLPAI